MNQKDNIIQPFNNKPNYLQISLIALSVLGFETFSFISVNFSSISGNLSILYRIIYLLICLIIIPKFLFPGQKAAYGKSMITIIIFWLLYFIRATYDTFLNPNTTISYIPFFWISALFLCFIPMFALLTSVNIITLNYSRKLVFSLAVIVNILCLYNNILAFLDNNFARLKGNEILNEITYGQIGAILIIMSFTYYFSQKKNYIYLAFIILGLINVGLAGSRGPLIEIIFVFIFYLFFNYKKLNHSNIITIILTIFLIGFFFSKYLLVFDSVISRINSTNGDEERNTLFRESWNNFIANPIIGSKAIGEYAHNIFLGSIEALGIFGGILIILIYKNAIIESIKLVKVDSTDWVALLLVMQLISALISGSIYNGFLFWSLLAFTSKISHNLYLYK